MIEGKQTNSTAEPLLAETLQLLLPSAAVTLLLQAALLQGDRAGSAWVAWRSTTPDPKAFLASDRVGIKRHLPLLYHNLIAHQVDLGRDLEPYFRAARAREELRSVRYRTFLGEAIATLQQNGVEFVVGKGVTVGETIHADPVLRHSHDIDLLVRSKDIAGAIDAMERAGFTASPHRGPNDELRFDHDSGLPVELHTELYRSQFYQGGVDAIWNRARHGEVLGQPVRLISDVDLLVQTPLHASAVRQRHSLSWMIDVVLLLRRREADGIAIDWMAVSQIASETRGELPLYVMYQFLVKSLAAPIPAALIGDLRQAAKYASRLQHLAAIDGLRADPQMRFKTILAASSPPSRRAIVTAVLLPPPAYLRGKYASASSTPLPWLYLMRPIRFVAVQLGKKWNGVGSRWSDSDVSASRQAFLDRLLPEERVLLGCIRSELSTIDAQSVAADVHDKPINWPAVFETAKRQGVSPLLSTNLKKCREQGLAVPPEVLKGLKGAMFAAIQTKETHARRLREVLEFMNLHRVTCMLIKGAASDAVVFKTPWHVVSLDIDLLIREPVESIPKSISDQIWDFNGHGPFECEFGSHHDLSIDGLLPIDYAGLWRDARRMTVQEHQVHVMCPEDMLISSCINACRKRFFHLKNLYGIRETIAKFSKMDWNRVAEKAAACHCSAIVYAALTVARLAVDANVSDQSLSKLHVGPIQTALIRFLASRRSFTPLTGRQAMSEQAYTIWSKRLLSMGNLSILLPYTAYTWRQRIHRLGWLSQTAAHSKPGWVKNDPAENDVPIDPTPTTGAR